MSVWVTDENGQNEYPDTGSISDGYHTFDELYEYRMLYNAAFFNELSPDLEKVHKSWRHDDGELCFGGGWFVVMATLPGVGQISNHYEAKDWDLFDIPERECADKWDGHTPQDVAMRLRKYLRGTDLVGKGSVAATKPVKPAQTPPQANDKELEAIMQLIKQAQVSAYEAGLQQNTKATLAPDEDFVRNKILALIHKDRAAAVQEHHFVHESIDKGDWVKETIYCTHCGKTPRELASQQKEES